MNRIIKIMVVFVAVGLPALEHVWAAINAPKVYFALIPGLRKDDTLSVRVRNINRTQEFHAVVVDESGVEIRNIVQQLSANEVMPFEFTQSGSQAANYLIGIGMTENRDGRSRVSITATIRDRDGSIVSTFDQRVFMGEIEGSGSSEHKEELRVDYFKAFPNPFLEKVEFAYAVHEVDKLTIQIWTSSGHLIKVIDVPSASERNIISWDGKDSEGNRVSTGVYLAELIATGASGKVNKRIAVAAVGER